MILLKNKKKKIYRKIAITNIRTNIPKGIKILTTQYKLLKP